MAHQVVHSKTNRSVNHILNKMTQILRCVGSLDSGLAVVSRPQPSLVPAGTAAPDEVARLREEVARLQDLLREQQAELERLKDARVERPKAPLAALTLEEMNAALQAALDMGTLGKAV